MRDEAWTQWTTAWHTERADFYAYLDLVGRDLPLELLEEVAITGVPTVEAARDSQDEKRILSALQFFLEAIERVMLAVAKQHRIESALVRVRAEHGQFRKGPPEKPTGT